MRNVLFLIFVCLMTGCIPLEKKPAEVEPPPRKMLEVRIDNGKYDADPGIKLLDERPPETRKEFVEKYGETNDMLFVKGENKFYGYVKDRLQVLDSYNGPRK